MRRVHACLHGLGDGSASRCRVACARPVNRVCDLACNREQVRTDNLHAMRLLKARLLQCKRVTHTVSACMHAWHGMQADDNPCRLPMSLPMTHTYFTRVSARAIVYLPCMHAQVCMELDELLRDDEDMAR
jgi:hypothetical protein